MQRTTHMLPRLFALAAAAVMCLPAQTPRGPAETLRFTVILSRHGVRSPLQTPEQLREYAPQPWPLFDSPTGYMPPVGVRLVQLMGAYYRDYFVQKGLIAPGGCADLDKVYIWADDNGRDIESAWALGRAILPACDITIHHVAEGMHDPLFAPLSAAIPGFGKSDPAIAKQAFLKSVGGSPEAMLRSYAADVETVNEALLGCKPGPDCPAPAAKVAKLIVKQPALNEAGTSSPLVGAADTIASAFELEYLSGLSAGNVAWGRLDAPKLQQVRAFHARYFCAQANPYSSKTNLSNLVSHMVRSLEQAASGTAVPGSLGKPGDKVLLLMGHDSDIVRVARLLGFSWELEKGMAMEALPDSALIFELWNDAAGKQTVRVHVQSQTFDQLRKVTPLSLKVPPARADLAVPGCGTANSCDWKLFNAAATAAIDPAFVAPDKPASATP